MGMMRVIGLFAIIPATVLLTISFFVLFTLRKLEAQGLKLFGYVIAALLWVAVLLVISSGLYVLSTGRLPMCCPIQEMMMKGKIHGMTCQQMPGMTQEKADNTMMKH
jgi:hypothetical protein